MKFTQESYIERVKGVHGDTYDYSETVFKKSSEKVKIICKFHGIFEQNAYKHILGRGCQKCGSNYEPTSQVISFDSFKQRAIEKHGDKFEYFEDSFIYITKLVTIKCPYHGLIKISGQSHLISKTGCQKCGFESIKQSKIRSYEDFITLANEIHKNKYDYSFQKYIRV
jgi:protein-arginine kinase activator protein McsA